VWGENCPNAVCVWNSCIRCCSLRWQLHLIATRKSIDSVRGGPSSHGRAAVRRSLTTALAGSTSMRHCCRCQLLPATVAAAITPPHPPMDRTPGTGRPNRRPGSALTTARRPRRRCRPLLPAAVAAAIAQPRPPIDGTPGTGRPNCRRGSASTTAPPAFASDELHGANLRTLIARKGRTSRPRSENYSR